MFLPNPGFILVPLLLASLIDNRDDGAEGCLVKITNKRIYIRNRTCEESAGFTEEILKYCTPLKRFGHFICEASVLGKKTS
jgi:hypothetical protein